MGTHERAGNHEGCYYGNFARSLTIPSGLKTDKAEEVKPKAINVKSKQLAEGKKVESKS